MTTAVYLSRRAKKKKRKRNGQPEYTWTLRWEAPDGWRSETCKTDDKTQADALRKSKWEELNLRQLDPVPEPEPEAPKPSWDACREAIERAMTADNLRPSSVRGYLKTFRVLQAAFADRASPADLTPADANEYKRRRAEAGTAAWTIKGDLSTLRAIFGKWLTKECALLTVNPFASVRAPKCDDPEVRIVTPTEAKALGAWLSERWNKWAMPLIYLDVVAWLGWRATEVASLRSEDLLEGGFVRVAATSNKTRRFKTGKLPPDLFESLKKCGADGWAFGRYPAELSRLLLVWKKRPHQAGRVSDAYDPDRLVGWLQDELQRFNEEYAKQLAAAAEKAHQKPQAFEPFTLHDFRRTAITGMQMAGVSEKEASIAVGATPEVMRKHYELMDQMVIARRVADRRTEAGDTIRLHQPLRAPCAPAIDDRGDSSQAVTA